MASQKDLDRAYMECAFSVSRLSHATRRKVGAIVVSCMGGIIAEGVNGTPSGFDNNCEHSINGQLATKPEVIHAESNAITKLARSTQSSVGATIYSTLSPCFECSKLIIQTGIVRVVYAEEYPYPGHIGVVRNIGLGLLREANIQVDHLPV